MPSDQGVVKRINSQYPLFTQKQTFGCGYSEVIGRRKRHKHRGWDRLAADGLSAARPTIDFAIAERPAGAEQTGEEMHDS